MFKLKWITKKHNKSLVILFLILLIVISVVFGYIYGYEQSKYSLVDLMDMEGFGEFNRENDGKVDDNLMVKYSFDSGTNGDVGNNTSREVLNIKKVLNVVNTRTNYYQIRFPYNAVRFKMKQLKLSFKGVELEEKQGSISVSLHLHKYYDKDNDFRNEYEGKHKFDTKKNTENNNLVSEANKIFTKEIFKKEFCPQGEVCGTNTTLKNNTSNGDYFDITLKQDELPDTVVTDYHAIWIGGNSAIKYEQIKVDIVGDVSGVEQVFRINKLATNDKKNSPIRDKKTINQNLKEEGETVREVGSILKLKDPFLPYTVPQLVFENDYAQTQFKYRVFFDIHDMYPFKKLDREVYLKSLYYQFNNYVRASGDHRVTVDNKVTFRMGGSKLCDFQFKKTGLNDNGDYFDISGEIGIGKSISRINKPIHMDLLKYVHSHDAGSVRTNYYLRMNILDIKYEIR